jgi:hypothetical protein
VGFIFNGFDRTATSRAARARAEAPRRLVERGVLSAEDARELIQQAEQDAAEARAQAQKAEAMAEAEAQKAQKAAQAAATKARQRMIALN